MRIACCVFCNAGVGRDEERERERERGGGCMRLVHEISMMSLL